MFSFFFSSSFLLCKAACDIACEKEKREDFLYISLVRVSPCTLEMLMFLDCLHLLKPSRSVHCQYLHITDGSKVLGNVYFGNQEGANHINSTWYQIVDKKTRDEGFVAIMSTGNANECVPVTESVYGSAKGCKCLSLHFY